MTDDLDPVARGEQPNPPNKGSDAEPWRSDEQPYADRPEQGKGDLRQEQDDVPAQEPPS